MDTAEATGISKITPAAYGSEEVISQFRALLADADMKQEFAALRIGRMQFRRRKKAERELTALYIGLWKLVLNRSFPNDATVFYEEYLRETYVRPGGRKIKNATRAFLNTVAAYVAMLEQKGDADFTDVARHLVRRLAPDSGDHKEMQLRLILIIRAAYKFLFDKLI